MKKSMTTGKALQARWGSAWGTWAFIGGFILLCCAFEYGRVMNLRPFPHHLSRQTAALSFTYTYWEKGNDLLDPQLQHLAADGLTTGRTVAECPILYYAMAQLWRLTGPSEFAYRAGMLLLHFIACFFLFRTLRRVLGHQGWSVMIALFFFTSPAVVYFAISFMPDVPAFDLMLLGLAVFFARWPQPTNWLGLFGSAALFSLAGLLKLPALMAPLVLLGLLVVETVLPKLFTGSVRLFQHKGPAGIALCFVLLVNAAWYHWAQRYVDIHRFPFSHSGTWAIWDLTKEQLAQALKGGSGVLVWQLFDTPAWLVFGGMLVFLIAHARSMRIGAWLALAFLLGGVTLFTLLWFITLDAHEYYFIIPLILPLFLTVTFLSVLKRRYPVAFASRWGRGLFLALLVYHAVYAANNHRMRTRANGQFLAENYLPIYHPQEVEFWDLVQYWSMAPCFRLEPYLDQIGVGQNDRVIVANDRTVCAALYLLKREGWVDFGMDPFDQSALDARIKQGARYFIYHENYWTPEAWLLPYLNEKVGQFEGMLIFDLHERAEQLSHP